MMSETDFPDGTEGSQGIEPEQDTADNQIQHLFPLCPTEIVQEIFELIVIDPYDGETEFHSLRAATILSQVCQLWRSIALHTPRLWAHVWIPLDKPTQAIQEYWDRTLERVKETAIYAHIIIPLGAAETSFPLRFVDIKSINTLQLEFAEVADVSMVVSDEFPVPPCSISKLVLKTTGEHYTRQEIGGDLSKLLNKWPKAPFVTVDNFNPEVKFESSTSIGSVEDFEAFHVSPSSLKTLVEAFPNLEKLSFRGVKGVDAHNDVVVFHSLKRLALRRWLYHNTLAKMSCPKLKELSLQKFSRISTRMLNFLQNHPTIVILELWHSVPSLRKLAVAAPQLETLVIGKFDHIDIFYDWEARGISSPPFPCLKALTMDVRSHALALEDFDQIVRHRCLSTTHPESLITLAAQERIRTMTFYYESEPKWLESGLLPYAEKTVYYQRRWGRDMAKVMLEWP